MRTRFAKEQEKNDWNKLVIANPDGGNIFQSINLANIKAENGWKIRLIMADNYAITVHERYIFGLGKFWYIPKGPGIESIDEIKLLIEPMKKFAHKNGVFLIKIEPEIVKTNENSAKLETLGLVLSRPIQANSSTVIIDLSKDIETIMTNLPQKSRHAINRAKRDGIITKLVEPNETNLQLMTDLMSQTMANKSTTIRSGNYYKKFWKTFTSSNMGALFFAYDNKKPIAGAFVLVYGNKATYKDGGSTKEKTIYGASHALQWHIIEWLKTKDIKSYDLCGTPSSEKIGDKNHPYYGIGLFKTSFNKKVTDFIGAYDIVIRQNQYKIWNNKAEKIIHRIYSLIFRKMFY